MEMHLTSVPCVGPTPANLCLTKLSYDLLALIASKSLFELEQVRATTTALSFKDFRGESSDPDSVETANFFVVPIFSAKAPPLCCAISGDSPTTHCGRTPAAPTSLPRPKRTLGRSCGLLASAAPFRYLHNLFACR